MPTRELSPEARDKLSRLAKARHANGDFDREKHREYGRMGGRPKGGSKKKQRISKVVAEAAMDEKNARAIVEVFKDAIHPSQPIHVRLKGASAWADVAMQSAKFDLSEEQAQVQQHSRQELIDLLAGKLTSGPAAALIRQQIEAETGIVDAEVVEDEAEDADEAA